MPMPSASPSPNAMGQMEGMHTMGVMDMGPLIVMNGEDMGIRVGSSDTNLISMGAMGSGTSWQPSSVTGFCVVLKARNLMPMFDAPPRLCSTTDRSTAGTGPPPWCGAVITLPTMGETRNTNSYTAESTIQFLDKNYLYTRLELVDKDELLRDSDRALSGITQHHPSFRIGAYTFGGVRDLWTTDKVQFGIGSDLTFYSTPSMIDRIYGNNPVSWKLFFRIRPGKMDMSMHGMHGTSDNMNQRQNIHTKH